MEPLIRSRTASPGGPLRSVVVAVAMPVAATGLSLVIQPGRALGAVSVFLLAVVAAAALGGVWAGVASSVLGFLSLTYFFTEPLHTLRVESGEDVVALVVFLVVSVIVGSLLARALAEHARASRREQEARLLSYFATKILSGERLDLVLGDFAAALIDPLRLARCEIHARAGARAFDVSRADPTAVDGIATSVPLAVGRVELGTITAVRVAGLPALAGDDLGLLRDAAKQVAVALERARLDSQIADAQTQAETSQARAALFSSVTHDLRTPLASIKAGVTTLMQEDVSLDDQQRRELLRTVLEETDRLNRLVGNLLDLSRVRAGALVPAKVPTAIDEVVESVLHRMEPSLSRVRVRTVLRDSPDIPADPVQIDQAVTNVLENAARWSPPGGEVLLAVSPWRNSVQIRIADQGPGIAPEERSQVFEAFYRGDDERSGSGLGLAIARAIVLAHGGMIRIEGSPGGGTAVVMELPISETEAVPQEIGT